MASIPYHRYAEPLRRATFSHCKTYRYSLTRKWNSGSTLLVVGLNPSTADEKVDDPTVRRCIGFAKSWRFGKLVVANLFAYRSADPTLLARVDDPIGPMNDRALKRLVAMADLVLVAWGTRGTILDRHDEVLSWLSNPHCLGITRGGFPRHPLYVRADAEPVRYVFG